MDTRDLRYFIAAAEVGNLHQAAERVGRSQPALSKCIRRLETEIGARLFEPAGRGLRLTDIGEALLTRARLLVNGMQATVREMTEMAQGVAGHIRIGVGPTTVEWLLPDLCRNLLREAPGVTLDVTTGLGDVLRQRLLEGQLDLVITPLNADDEVAFSTVVIAEDTMVVAARCNHQLDRADVRVEELDGYAWLLPAGRLASTEWLFQRCNALGLGKPRVQIETDTVIMLRRVVSQTDLLTFLSRRDLRPGLGLREIEVGALAYRRSIGTLSALGGHLSPIMARLIALLMELAD
jgi:DNA-binding transcriptional LysR family regulator